MKRLFVLLTIIIIVSGCDTTEPILEPNPLNGKWKSVKIDEMTPYILVEMQLLEVFQAKDGVVYGGLINGSGGYEFMHWWIEFEITSGVSDRTNNSIRMTFITESLYVDGNMIRSTGKIEGKIISESLLSAVIQINEIGRAFELIFEKVNQ